MHEIPRYNTLLSSEEFQTVFYSRTELHALKSRAAVPDVLIFEEDNVVHESTVVLTAKDLRRCFYNHEDISAMMADAMRDAKTLRNKHDMAGVECMTKSGKVKQVLNRRLARSAVLRVQKDNDNDDDEDVIAAAYTAACQDATKQALDRGRMHASVVSGESYDIDIIRMIQQERRKQDALRKQERKAKKQQQKELEQQQQEQQQQQQQQPAPEPALVVDFLPSDLPKEKKSKKSSPKSSSKQKKSKKNKKVNPTDDSENDDDSVESSASSVFSFFSRSSRRSTKSSGTTRTSRGSRKSSGRSVTNSRKSRKGTMRR